MYYTNDRITKSAVLKILKNAYSFSLIKKRTPHT